MVIGGLLWQWIGGHLPGCFLFALILNKHSLSLFTFLFFIHLFHVYSSFFFWCLVQSGLFLFL